MRFLSSNRSSGSTRSIRKSNKQRRAEIKAARNKRAAKLDNHQLPAPRHAVLADHAQLGHVCPCNTLPLYYMDRPFVCRDCGSNELWTAQQQKWWYEVVKGRLDSTAVRCRPCRVTERQRKAQARAVHFAGLAMKAQNEKACA